MESLSKEQKFQDFSASTLRREQRLQELQRLLYPENSNAQNIDPDSKLKLKEEYALLLKENIKFLSNLLAEPKQKIAKPINPTKDEPEKTEKKKLSDLLLCKVEEFQIIKADLSEQQCLEKAIEICELHLKCYGECEGVNKRLEEFRERQNRMRLNNLII
jgi:hypothetical protein